jgi:hypothetical protein
MRTYGRDLLNNYYSIIKWFPVFASAELLLIEVAKDAELREKAKQATPWIGYQCGDKPLRHRCVRPNDAKTGNLVLLDVRNANNTKDMLTGDWEASYQLGTIVSRQVDNIDETMFVLHLVMWEPYYRDETNEFRPLWVENALRAGSGQHLLPSYRQDGVRLTWCPIKQVPLEITRKLLNNPS